MWHGDKHISKVAPCYTRPQPNFEKVVAIDLLDTLPDIQGALATLVPVSVCGDLPQCTFSTHGKTTRANS